MNYQTGSSSIAPSSIYATETDSISPLLVRNIDLPLGRLTSIPMYKPDQSGVKDPDEIVMISVPVVLSESAGDEATRGRKSLFSRLKSNSTPKTKLKIALMPRSECEQFFARDEKGSYIGVEEQRTWTEQELEDRYGKYKAALPAAPMKYQSPDKVTGGFGLS